MATAMPIGVDINHDFKSNSVVYMVLCLHKDELNYSKKNKTVEYQKIRVQ